MGSIEYAKLLLSTHALVFFEVWVQDYEDIDEIMAEIANLECAARLEPGRRVVKVFPLDRIPKTLIFP